MLTKFFVLSEMGNNVCIRKVCNSLGNWTDFVCSTIGFPSL